MADHALLVGCDAYPYLPGADLAAAVGDALAVRDWLVGPGRVQAENVVFLASPSRAGPAVPPEVAVTGPAGIRCFARELRRLADRTDVGPDDRLYVYFAGHGCGTDPNNAALSDDALVFTDFSEDVPGSDAVGLRHLLAHLEQTRFGAVLLLLDACRDFPFRRSFQLGGPGFDPPAAERRAPPRLYLLQATLPGRRAYGGRSKDGTRVGFTAALLDGLAGVAVAKEYDDRAARPYVVRWSTLVAYVETAVADQEPRSTSQGDLLLADFPDGSFDEVELTVSVHPEASRANDNLELAVTYRDPSFFEDPLIRVRGPAPARFRVPPRRHLVTARTASAWGRSAVDAYTNTSVEVALGQGLRQPPRAGKGTVRGTESGRATITTDDPAAAIVVTTPDGASPLRGVGRASGLLTDGQYTVTVTDAFGMRHRELLDVQPEFGGTLSLELPNPPGGAERDGPLRWVGPAAAFASGRPQFSRPNRFTCLATHPFQAAGRSHDGASAAIPVVGVSELWWSASAPAATRWVDLRFGNHRLELPAAPGMCATVELDATGLLVMYFDQAHLDDQQSLIFVERAQRLMSAGRFDAATVVLGAERRRTALDGVLLGAYDTPLRRLARAAVAPEDRAYVLPGNQWAVLLNRPPTVVRPRD